jgi:hypothetical protein
MSNKKADLVNNFYSSIYLTFISLLQGIALVLLLPELITHIKTTQHPFTDVSILPFVLTLLVVFVVWHHYTFQVLYIKWFPNILDAILPFGLGIAEFFLISYVTSKTPGTEVDLEGWTITYTAFHFLGSFAYFGLLRNDINLVTHIMSRENAVKLYKYNKNLGVILGCSLLLQSSFSLMIVVLHATWLLWFSLVFFLLHVSFAEYYVTTRTKPLFIRSIEEFDEEKIKSKKANIAV